MRHRQAKKICKKYTTRRHFLDAIMSGWAHRLVGKSIVDQNKWDQASANMTRKETRGPKWECQKARMWTRLQGMLDKWREKTA